jgi:hypothetical protein
MVLCTGDRGPTGPAGRQGEAGEQGESAAVLWSMGPAALWV